MKGARAKRAPRGRGARRAAHAGAATPPPPPEKPQLYIKSRFRDFYTDYDPARTVASILEELSEKMGLPAENIKLFCYDAETYRKSQPYIMALDDNEDLSEYDRHSLTVNIMLTNGASLVHADQPWRQMTDMEKTLRDYSVDETSSLLMTHSVF
jgi:hypothetical protein